MSIVTAQQLGKSYGAQDLFAGVEFSIAHGDKVALVGPNGAGKTTLLRLILRLEEPTLGSVQCARALRLGYLPQSPSFPSKQTLYGEMLSVFASLRAQQQALELLAEQMSGAEDPTELMARYAEAEHQFDLGGGYSYEEHIRRVLGGLGFASSTFSWPIDVLSGGQVTRAMLAKLLLQEPDLLVLDEPTNYLDLEALEWLESYLREWPQSLLVVSHDRYFLDHVVTRVWDLEHGRLEGYRGNYSDFTQQKRARLERQRREYEAQQEQIAQTEDFIRRYKAGQRSKQARGRETILARTERLEPPPTERRMQLRMGSSLRAGDNVLMSEGATIGYPSEPASAEVPGQVSPTSSSAAQATASGAYVLFETGEFLIRRGQRVALLGPNGSGKTTFLRAVAGELSPLVGRIRHGASVRIGYLPQTCEWLDRDKTVLEQVLAVHNMPNSDARHLLARFLFYGDDIHKSLGTLSGGELARVALAILTIRGANLLLLDEPTTHLDISSQETMQSVLCAFGGTILFVSHDRYLIDALATHVWVIADGRMRQFEGNYTSYLGQLENERQMAQTQEPTPRAVPAMQRDERRQQRQAERTARKQQERTVALEQEIGRLEAELATVSRSLELASNQQDVGRVLSLSQDYERVEAALAERLRDWEECLSLAGEQRDGEAGGE